ncbi:hypothetical protein [Kiloniella majae]|uniref:hypothetical protein n=1 Tax=Kiloniella majae TaxID=1938558 RepID=UPI000A277636|nr:hypothetical protein [Kiloniella majae]
MKRLFLLPLLILLSKPILAEEIKVGKRSIKISSIDGFCLLDPSIETESEILKRIQENLSPNSHLVSVLPLCSTLKDYRAYISSTFSKLFTSPPNIEVYFQTLTPKISLDHKQQDKERSIIDNVCSAMSKNPAMITPQTLANKEIELTFLTNLKSNETATLGLLRKTKNTCYFGALKNHGKSQRVDLIIGAPQILDGLSVIHYFVSPYTGFEEINKSVEKLQEFITTQ